MNRKALWTVLYWALAIALVLAVQSRWQGAQQTETVP